MGIFKEIEKQGFQAAYLAEQSLSKLGSELNQMDIDLINEYVQHLKEKCEKANDEASISGLNIPCVTITEGKFCPNCGKRKNMKGDGTLELLCEC